MTELGLNPSMSVPTLLALDTQVVSPQETFTALPLMALASPLPSSTDLHHG